VAKREKIKGRRQKNSGSVHMGGYLKNYMFVLGLMSMMDFSVTLKCIFMQFKKTEKSIIEIYFKGSLN